MTVLNYEVGRFIAELFREAQISHPYDDGFEPDPDSFGYVVYSAPVVTIELDGEEEDLIGTPRNVSGITFTRGTVYTLEEFQKEYPGEQVVLNNFRMLQEQSENELKIIQIDDQFRLFRPQDNLLELVDG